MVPAARLVEGFVQTGSCRQEGDGGEQEGGPETPRRQGPPDERRAAGALAHGGGGLLGELWVCPDPGPPALGSRRLL